jgi:hypothetical protein
LRRLLAVVLDDYRLGEKLETHRLYLGVGKI